MDLSPPGIPQESGDVFYDSFNGVKYVKTAAGQWRVVENKQGRFQSVGDYAPVFLGQKPKNPDLGHIWYPTSGEDLGKSFIYNGSDWVLVSGGGGNQGPPDAGSY